MDTCINKIRELSLKLLEENEVKKVIGFAEGTIPMATSPVTITRKQDVEKLVFNSTCGLNLANYIRNQKDKIAVIAKGCDTRNIVTHIVENQVQREKLYIIGVPCNGMIDKSKIESLFEDEIIEFSEDGGKLNVKSSLKEEKLNKSDYLRKNCRLCMHKNPVIYDVLAGDLVEEQNFDNPYPDVDEIEAMNSETKWQHFEDLTKNCIRCYACRNACPICYCPTCFVDESGPQWVGKGQDKTDVNTFHFLRAFHCAGRCTDCGACVEACPMDINVRDFTRKLNKDSFEMFGWEAGLDIARRPPLDVYSPNDPDDFIK
ncbi:MAG: 4Fe-4S ferredoxin [Deltaproteobacteria bacterium]|nr:4Fe-4S ferredoxin [Deltaproteobacteria bacterium]